ncbi:MAG: hypothetical protein K2X27_07095 [Candidatus Obscuribacterales bacterium]|nr:hypothetical protein [Candidatus Obscuribacterales bacterium]
MSTTSDEVEEKSIPGEQSARSGLTVRIVSFGYKLGKPPAANALFDVRFLKNPYWVEELRPMSGKDKPVQDYVLAQKAAQDFLESLLQLLKRLVPQLIESNMTEFSIAFGCTGGQHRSATMVEMLALGLNESFPELHIEKIHRELDSKAQAKTPEQENGT